jgi:probable phosphoglycerate mutase
LTALGRAEAQAVAWRVAGAWKPSKIYTSPMGRCIETGAAIAEACGAPREVCDDLTDIDYGAWQFKTFEYAKTENPILFAAWFATPHLIRFPNGESLQDLVARAANALRFVLARHPDDTIVLVGHDSVNRALLMQLLDQPLSAYWRLAQSPCCLNEIDITDGKISVQRVNETGYLEALAR